jgi:hypothetical protein
MVCINNALVEKIYLVARQAERSLASSLPVDDAHRLAIREYYQGGRINHLKDVIEVLLSYKGKRLYPTVMGEPNPGRLRLLVDLPSRGLSWVCGRCLFTHTEIGFVQESLRKALDCIEDDVKDTQDFVASRMELFDVEALMFNRFHNRSRMRELSSVENYGQPNFSVHTSIDDVLRK